MPSLPALVCKLSHGHEAWIVGSAADPEGAPAQVRDYDVLVPNATGSPKVEARQ